MPKGTQTKNTRSMVRQRKKERKRKKRITHPPLNGSIPLLSFFPPSPPFFIFFFALLFRLSFHLHLRAQTLETYLFLFCFLLSLQLDRHGFLHISFSFQQRAASSQVPGPAKAPTTGPLSTTAKHPTQTIVGSILDAHIDLSKGFQHFRTFNTLSTRPSHDKAKAANVPRTGSTSRTPFSDP